MAGQSQAVVRFGVFEANLQSGELRKHGLRLRVPGQPFKILTILLERPGQVISREELQKSLWPSDTFVDFEHSLNSAVKKLREALGDSVENPRYIETLPRLGYRFVAPVTCSGLGAVAETAAAHEGTVPQATEEKGPLAQVAPAPPADAAQRISHAGGVTGRTGVRKTRALGIAALLAIVLAAALLGARLWRTRGLPFETVLTTRLTSDGESLKAAISPDGRYIAHTLVRSGQESLRVTRATTLHQIEIVPPQPVHYLGITFSPDSETVYYVTHAAEAEPSVLNSVPVLGGSIQKLKKDLASPVTFSPDGKRFAFVRESASESTLIVADLNSGSEQRLLTRKLPAVLDYPAWSPDGRVIACTTVDTSVATPRGSEARIIEVRVHDGAERTLSRRAWGFIRQLAWFADGRGLVMSARDEHSGIFHVWHVSYPGGDGRKVTGGLNNQVGASVSADSRQIVTVEESTLSGIWRMRSMEGPDPEPLVSGLSGWSPAVWIPNGRIVFEKELNGSRNIWAADADGKNQKQLTLEGNNYNPSLSSDGRKLAYLSDRNGIPAIWTMDIDGGNPVMVVKAFGETAPQLSPDGKWIAFTAIAGGQWKTLWRVKSRGGQAVQLSDALWHQPAISPDGKRIAGFYADQQLSTQKEPVSLAVVGIDGGRPWKVIPMAPSVSMSAGIRWNPDTGQLTYVDRGKDGDNIWSQPLNGGPPHQISRFHGETLFSFDWSPDGKQLVFSRGIQARDVVLIQDARQK